MKNRREFLTAGGALAALTALPQEAKADPPGFSIYITGMVWNRQLAAPMNDWLLKVYAKADVMTGNHSQPAIPGFATVGDDFHDGPGSHIQIQNVALQGSQLTITGFVTESKTPGLAGQPVTIQGKVEGTAVQGLTVTIGGSVFSGSGLLVVIAIIAILIG